MKLPRLTLPLLLCAALPALAENKLVNKNYDFEEDKPWQEAEYALPAYPAQPQWLEFDGYAPSGGNRFYIDTASLSVGQLDSAVRLTLRVQSPSGVDNLSVEGVQCKDAIYRTYAFGDTRNQKWIASLNDSWRPIQRSDVMRRALRERVCPGLSAPRDAAEALRNFKSIK